MKHREPRILAVEARYSRFGYALFEGPARLLDWGASTVTPRLAHRAAVETAHKRIASVLRLSCPAAIVVKRPRRTRTGNAANPGPVLKAIIRSATTLQIPVHCLRREDVQEALHSLLGRTKDEVAAALVDIFPELLARLPPQRKAWQSERHAMIVFDAIATGFAYWRQNGTQDRARDEA
jgi:hypothetical protein